MPRIPNNLYKFIPMSGDRDSNCACYVLYDWHPRDSNKIDITICSRQGYVQEFYKRNLISSIKIDIANNFKHIRIIRNSKAELFYILATDNEVIILSRREELVIHETVRNVAYYEILDEECTGEAKIKIVTIGIPVLDGKLTSQLEEYSEIYLSSDNNFKNGTEEAHGYQSPEDYKPVIKELQKKLNESNYNLHFDENALKNIKKLRQLASYSSQETDAANKEILKPTVVFCNKKIVLLMNLTNIYEGPIEKVCVFIHNNGCNSISYTTKLFEILLSSPYYKEKENQKIIGGETAKLVVVIPIKEFKSSLNTKIEFNLVVSYQRFVTGEQVKEYLHPCHNVEISACEVMEKDYDIFDRDLNSEVGKLTKHSILAMLAATDKTTLCLEHFGANNYKTVEQLPAYMLEKYLKMEVIEFDKIGFLLCSPHHILYGIMIIFPNYDDNEIFFKIDVYARSPLQVLALIHFIYDSVPQKLVVTTPSVQIKRNELSQEYNKTTNNDTSSSDYTLCTSSLLEQASMTLSYFDECLKTMNSNMNAESGNEIDIFAMGFDKYTEYRNKMLTEAKNVIQTTNLQSTNEYLPDSQDSDCVMMSIEHPA